MASQASSDKSNNSILVFNAQSFEPYGTANSSAVPSVVNARPVVAFTANNLFCFFSSPFPSGNAYRGSGVEAVLRGFMNTATSGNAAFQGSIERISEGAQFDLSGDSFATAVDSGDVAVPGTAKYPFDALISFDADELDGLLPGESFRFQIKKVVPSGGNATGTYYLVSLELRNRSA